MEKLLKKLSVLDYVVFIVVVVVIVGFFVFYSRENVTVYVSTVNEWSEWLEDPMPPPYWLSNALKVGDKAFHTSGGELAEIIGIENTDWGGQRRFSRLNLKAKALYNVRSKVYLLKEQPLFVGGTLTLNFKGVQYRGVITYVGTTPEFPESKLSRARLEVFIPEVYPWLAETYNKDYVVKDTNGLEIFRIISSRIIPTERSIVTDDGRILRRSDPYYKDVYFVAEAQVRCQEGTCYYNDTFPLRIGAHIRIHSTSSLVEEKAIIKNYEILD